MNARVWLDRGTELLLSAVEQLSDAGLRQPSLLPGWTRAHVIAHVHYNAEALRRLVAWAATGREHRMYTGPDQRQTEIEHGATLPADALRALVRRSAADLRAGLNALPDSAMDHPVVTAQGRTVPAREITWLRAREVAVHAVDLANGVTFDDLPREFVAALVVEAAAKHAAGGQAADLAGWLTGRAADPPRLGSWL
jgi:maleylpyruvate isomerase